MAILASDTSSEMERLQIRLLREFTPAKKLAMLRALHRAAAALSDQGLRLRHPAAAAREIDRRRADLWLGPRLAALVHQGGGVAKSGKDDCDLDPLSITAQVARALETLGVRYLVGGSLASSLHGEPRFTRDADVVAELALHHAEPLVRVLEPSFYLDLEAVRGAISRRASFNMIHLAAAFKVDVFVAQGRPFDEERFARREQAGEAGREIYFSSAEDTVLSKLEWYRKGGEVSDHQWRDVLAVLAVQRGRLQLDYLRRWAAELGIADLLERALADSASAERAT